MVVDTAYYDSLQVRPTATAIDIKKAYRKLAIIHHPDKNPNDETAHLRFQEISEAYQVLSNPDLRSRYDKYGKEKAQPDTGFEDPSEFFSMIFGGEAFADWIGEISLMKDLAKTMEITMKDLDLDDDEAVDEAAKEAAKETTAGATNTNAGQPSPAAAATGATPHSTASTKPPMSKAEEAAWDRKAAEEEESGPPPAYSESAHQKESFMKESHLKPESSTPPSASTPPRRQPSPGVQMLTDRPDDEIRAQSELHGADAKGKGKKKGGLSKEQREELAKYEEERRRIREERITTLVKKLIDRVSLWTETDRNTDVTEAFRAKITLEVENLKMESFGIDILHSVGITYYNKGSQFLKSQKFLGITGFFSRLKDKGTFVKDTWSTISGAIDAQMAMEEMVKAEERGGDDWTDEKKAMYERKVTGKILAAAWRGSRFEITTVVREVCDRVLGDKTVKLEKRCQRAEALVIIGTILSQAKRDEDEEFAEGVFEQLVAEASQKKDKKKEEEEKEKERKKEKEKNLKGFFGGAGSSNSANE